MTDSALLGLIRTLEDESYGFATGSLAEARGYAIDRYLARPYGNEVDGRSNVVATDLRDTVEWALPQIMRVFLSGDEIIKFEPTGPEDEGQAKQETSYLNYVILQKNDAFGVLSTWFRDALLSKNGYVKAYWEERSDIRREQYDGLTDDMLAVILSDPAVELSQHSPYPDPAFVAPPPQPQMPGQPPIPAPVAPTLHDVVLRRKHPTSFARIENVPPEEIYVHRTVRGLGLADAIFVQHRVRKTISEVRQDGYDVPDDVADSGDDDSDDAVDAARDRFADESGDDDTNASDRSLRRVTVRECYLRTDYDGDGVAELRKVCVIGGKVWHNEETDMVPFACVSPIIFPHKHIGIGFDDLCDMPSQIKTTLMRQGLDNMHLANNGRYVVDVLRVNVDDLLVSRPGGIVRAEGDPGTAVMPLTHPATFGAAMQGIEWVDGWRGISTGVFPEAQNMSSDVLNNATATGIAQAISAGQARIEAVTRAFAVGVRDLFGIVHALTLKHATAAEKVKLNNTWVTVDPREWVARKNMTITVGLGTGTRETRIAQLMQLAGLQAQGVQAGIVTPTNLYNTGTRITEELGYRNADEFWSDPAKQPPQPKQPPPEVMAAQIGAQGLAQAEAIKAKSGEQRAQIDAASEIQKARIDDETERYRILVDAATKLLISRREHETEAAKLALDASEQAGEAMRRASEARGVADAANGRELQAPVDLSPMMQVIAALVDRMNAPREIVRDPRTGRAVGTRLMQ